MFVEGTAGAKWCGTAEGVDERPMPLDALLLSSPPLVTSPDRVSSPGSLLAGASVLRVSVLEVL